VSVILTSLLSLNKNKALSHLTVERGTGCVAEDDRPVPVVMPEPAYEELYPHYVELCAVSQFRSKGGDLGGVPGHAVMYLKGACRKADAPYPELEMCAAPSDDPESLDHGVGVSVNKMFKNINRMATPGRDLFFRRPPRSGRDADPGLLRGDYPVDHRARAIRWHPNPRQLSGERSSRADRRGSRRPWRHRHRLRAALRPHSVVRSGAGDA
jgi:hypothetical protein